MATGGNVNIGAQFTGSAAAQAFNQAMAGSTIAAGNFSIAIGQINAHFNTFMANMGSFNTIVGNSINTTINLMGDLNNVLNGFLKNMQTMTVANNTLSASMGSNNNIVGNTITLYQRLGSTTDRWILSLHSVSRIIQSQIISRYTQAVFGNLDQTITAAADLDIKIAAIRTISQEASITQAQWRNEVRRLSDEFGNPILDTAAGTYEAISNQVAKGASAVRFMNEAMLFGKTTIATTAEAVNLLSSVINGYNLSAEEASRISAVFFRTIELGRVTASELANTLGPVTTSAHLLGISLEEIGAAEAILTSQGTKANTALTLISNIINKLVKPSEDMKKWFKEIGVNSGEAAIATYGFAGVIEKMGALAEKGGLTALAAQFKDLRAIRGIAGLTGGNILGDFRSVLDQITSGSESYLKAQEIMMQSAGNKFKTEVNKIQNILTVDYGNAFLELITRMAGGADFASGVIKGTSDAIYALAVSIGDILGFFVRLADQMNVFNLSTSQVIIGITGISAAISVAAIVPTITTMGAAFWTVASSLYAASIGVTAFNLALNATNPLLLVITTAVIAITTAYALWIDSGEQLKKKIARDLQEVHDSYDALHKARIEQIQTENRIFKRALEEQSQSTNQALATISKGWTDFSESLNAQGQSVEDQIKILDKFLEKAQEIADSRGLTAVMDSFANSLKRGNSLEIVSELIDSLERMRETSEQALGAGNLDLATKAFDDFRNHVQKTQDTIEKIISDSINRQQDASKSFQERKFDLALEGMSGSKAKQTTIAEVQRLLQDADSLGKAGKTLEANRALVRAKELAEKETRNQQDANKSMTKLGLGGKLDLSLEEQVAKARDLFELNVQTTAQIRGAKAEELLTEEQITAEIQRRLDLRNMEVEAIKKAQSLQTTINLATTQLKENLPKLRQEVAADRDRVAKDFASLASMSNANLLSVPASQRAVGETSGMMLSSTAGRQLAEDLAAGVALQEANKKYESRMKLVPKMKPETQEQTDRLLEIAQVQEKAEAALSNLADREEQLRNAEAEGILVREQLKIAEESLSQYAKTNLAPIFEEIGKQASKPLETMADRLQLELLEFENIGGMAFPGMKKPGFNQGGIVSGAPGFDNIVVAAMAGEAFINKEMTARYYPTIKAINAGTHQTNNSNVYNMHFTVNDTAGGGEALIRDIAFQMQRGINRGQIPGMSRRG